MSNETQAAPEVTEELAPKTYPFDVTLPSGKILTVKREAKVRDMYAAQKRIHNPEELMQGIISITMMLDGKPIVFEDVSDWPFGDYTKAIEHVGKF